MKTLVTGGAGFIGSHLCEGLLAHGHGIRVLDNFSTGKREHLAAILNHPDFELVEGDIRDPDTVAAAMAGMDGAYHLAAMVSVPQSVKEPRLSHESNAGGTFNVLEAARVAGVPRVVYASSSAVYGDNPVLPLTESAAPAPTSPYGLDKWYGEELARLYDAQYGLETMAMRFFNVYGPRQDPRNPYSGVITLFLDCLKNGSPPTIFGDGEQTRDFVHVTDIAAACLAAMRVKTTAAAPSPGSGCRVYNVASGERISINALYTHLQAITGVSTAAEYAPARAGDVLHTLGDISAIQGDLGYRPSVDLRSGLQGVYDYFKAEG